MPTRRTSNIGTPKIHGAKPRKSTGLISANYLDDNNNDTMPLDELKVPVTFESNEVSADGLEKLSSLLAPSSKMKNSHDSINTPSSNKAIIRSELEKLFEEKRTDWKRCEFVKACIERNIHLNDNAEQNKKKLFTWFDGKKNREKQMSKLDLPMLNEICK
ncbi:hypothetical protein F8M41_006084 [Gigaspora margarita]|uniref:Uncharacterized protein n=1 Tax=Gigaspora margarita TaxID=4874 RepID=A0A8H3X9M0_GIGMA|nr:hypothetical protein F8M41_006084 [Gigaspora margarita]